MKFERDINCESPYFSNVSKVTYEHETDLQTFTYLGYTYLIFACGKTDYFDHQGVKHDIPKIFLKGPGDYYSTKGYKGSCSVAFELPAQAMHLATGKPVTELKNINLDLGELVPSEILDNLFDNVSKADGIDKIKKHLSEAIEQELISWNKRVKTSDIVDLIHSKKGLISKKEITDKFSISERSLERYFLKEVGISPYLFISQIRFNNILQDLQVENNNINQLIVDYNYFDRSHFEKDFEKFLGKRIVEYKNGKPSLFEAALKRTYDKV